MHRIFQVLVKIQLSVTLGYQVPLFLELTGSPIAISVVTPTTPNWITALMIMPAGEVTVNFNPPTLGVTVTTSYNYEFNLLGNNFGCTVSPSPISGTVSISPTDKITF